MGFLAGTYAKKPACQCRRHRRHKRRAFSPWVRKIPWRREWQLAPVFLPGEFHGQRSLEGGPWGRKESDTTEAAEHTHTHTHCTQQYSEVRAHVYQRTKVCQGMGVCGAGGVVIRTVKLTFLSLSSAQSPIIGGSHQLYLSK